MSPLIAALSALLAGVPVHVDPAATRGAPAQAGADPLVAEARQLTQQAAGTLAGEALCAHLARTERLASKLGARMQKAAAQASPGRDAEPSAKALEQIERDGKRAQAPGLVITAVSAEGLEVGAWVDLAAYAHKLHVPGPERALLEAFSVFAGHGRSEDLSLRFVTDEQACTTFEPVARGLAQLAGPWSSAPACLRAHVLPRLRAALGAFAKPRTCLCEDAPTAKRLAAQAATQLATLSGVDTAPLGSQLTAAAVVPGARYRCDPTAPPAGAGADAAGR